VDHPDDPGGRTAHGITQATYDAWLKVRRRKPADVWAIAMPDVEAIYRQQYWDAIRGDDLATVREKVAVCAFDAAVNHGVGTSVRMLQRTVRAEPDGVAGRVTLSCLRLRLMAMGETQILTILLERRRGLYQGLLLKNPKLSVFRKGWRNRLNSLCEYVGVEPLWDDLPPAA
jgi:lysozyme family protein